MRKNILVGLTALTTLGWAGTAHADDADSWQLHGFGDYSVKKDYITPRGLVVTRKGAMVHLVNGLSVDSPSGVSIFATTFVALNPGYGDVNKEVFNEFDWSVGVAAPVAKHLTASVEYMQWIFPAGGPKTERNVEFALKYADPPSASGVSINPYAKVFIATNSKSSTVVLGKTSGTGYLELGAVPTYKGSGFSLSAPTWISIGPKNYWVDKSNQATVAALVPGGKSDNFGVFSTGLKLSAPLTFLSGHGGASAYLFGQYYHLINDGLVASEAILNSGAHKRDKFNFGAGISFGF